MHCPSSTATLTPAVARSSNLQHYRALLQVLAYASQREQTAEQVIRDAIVGGVVVPFIVTHNTNPAVVAMSTGDVACSTPLDASISGDSLSREEVSLTALLLPSSKFIGTTASLLADGFFCFAPLSSTVENSRTTPYQHRSECQVRDLFTFIMLLFPECFVAEIPPRTLLAMRDAEWSASQMQSSNHAESEVQHPSPVLRRSTPTSPLPSILPRGQCTPSTQRVHTSVSDGRGIVVDAESLPHSVTDVSLGGIRTAPLEGLPQLLSPVKLALNDTGASDGEGLEGTTANASVMTNMMALPVVNPVLLTVDVLDVLLESRRSLAVVLLSLMNDALREVQYRQIEQSHAASPRTKVTTAARHPSCEAGVLQFSAEVLLTAKMLLMSVISASAMWRQRVSKAMEIRKAALPGAAPPPPPLLSPFSVLSELLGEKTEGTSPFLTLPVEQWIWGKEKDALEQWNDRLLDRLLMATDAAGVRLDAYLNSAKSTAVSSGRSVSYFPTLLLHRPSDGQPAVELSLASVSRLSDTVRLPSLPIQEGEVHLLLCPSVLENKTGMLRVRGSELLLDTTASPTADFFQACASSACSEAQLQPSGDAVPWLFRRRLTDLSSTEQGIVVAALSDPATISVVLEKNAAMLVRLTLWCRDRWPPLSDASAVRPSTANLSNVITNENGGPKAVYSIGDQVEQHILFERPFSAAVGRYVRELVTLRGLSKDVLEAWMRHVCRGPVATPGAAVDSTAPPPHRAMFAALVKFAVLHNRWRLNPEVEALEKEYVM
ncbi:hypothetical protein LPMP_351270 [Leishmania panamensis]|uniref:Uncharacterized protein n=2 Tax=Leishmania panamensis TaxID=5679 RepID=A0AC62A573_LEIPA